MTTDYTDIELAASMRRHPAGSARETELRTALMDAVERWENTAAENDHLGANAEDAGDWVGMGRAYGSRDAHNACARAIRGLLS